MKITIIPAVHANSRGQFLKLTLKTVIQIHTRIQMQMRIRIQARSHIDVHTQSASPSVGLSLALSSRPPVVTPRGPP